MDNDRLLPSQRARAMEPPPGPDDPMTTDELREIVHLVTTKQPMPEGRRRRFQETFRSMKQTIADDRANGFMTYIPSD